VTFALDLDLEHTLDAGLPDDYRVQVWWRSVHLRARTSDLRESLQTDGRTDDGRLAIVLAHSWNELQMEVDKLVMLLMFGFFQGLISEVSRSIDTKFRHTFGYDPNL